MVTHSSRTNLADRPEKSARISVNKLAEYLVAGPRRRRRIIEDQKAPRTFITARYAPAETAIIRYFTQGSDEKVISDAIEALTELRPETDWEAARNVDCVAALEHFWQLRRSLSLDGFTMLAPKGRQQHLEVASVEVSVRPEVLLYSAKRSKPCGAIKLAMSKTYTLSEHSGSYVGGILRRFLCATTDTLPHADDCIVLDIFGKQAHHAPRAMTRLMEDVTAACEEIAARW